MLHESRPSRPWLIFDVRQYMHPKLVFVISLIACASLCASELEFAGYLRSGAETRFVVANARDGKVSGWLVVGEKFQEYTITAFDAKEEILSLAGAGGILRLHLKPSRVAPALPNDFRQPLFLDVTPQGEIVLGRATLDVHELRKKLADAVAADPQVAIIVRTNVEADSDRIQPIFKQVREIAQSVGARGIGLIAKPPNKVPEPAP